MSFLGRVGRSLLAGGLTYAVGRTVQIVADRPHRVAHEAGHALLFWRSPYTVEFERVALRFNLFSLQAGYTSARRPRAGTRDFVLDDAIIFMGGLAGELVGLGRCEPEGGRNDILFARECLALVAPATPPRIALRQATAAACRRLAGDRQAYERLRTALDACGELESRQMVRILGLPASRGGRGALDARRRTVSGCRPTAPAGRPRP